MVIKTSKKKLTPLLQMHKKSEDSLSRNFQLPLLLGVNIIRTVNAIVS